jgi:Predicted metal-dependent hydrolase of the TIM-barrel fold
MKYIDVHLHLGDCRVFDCDVTEEQMMKALDLNKINAAIVQPFPGAADYKDVHERIYALTKKYPGRIYGLVSINPHMPKEQYKDEVRHYVKDYGFLGVKIHTTGHATNPLSKDAETVYEIASELDIPVMIHTGTGAPFALPSVCTPAAKKYPNVKFVLAHSGSVMFAREALILAQECDNVYLDATWSAIYDMVDFAHVLGSKRLLYASDDLKNMGVEIKKYELLDLKESELEDIFYKNAISVFKIKDFK